MKAQHILQLRGFSVLSGRDRAVLNAAIGKPKRLDEHISDTLQRRSGAGFRQVKSP